GLIMRKLIAALLATTALAACGEVQSPGASTATVYTDNTQIYCQFGRVAFNTSQRNCAMGHGTVLRPPIAPTTPSTPPSPPPAERVVRAQMTQKGTGYYVDVAIASVCCFKMLIDTGASDVSVPIQIFRAMVKDGLLTREDMIDVVGYRTANGVVEGLRFR